MKKLNITNFKNMPSFGYNKEYHDEVENYLSTRTKGKPMAMSLLEADKFTLAIEDRLCEMEKILQN